MHICRKQNIKTGFEMLVSTLIFIFITAFICTPVHADPVITGLYGSGDSSNSEQIPSDPFKESALELRHGNFDKARSILKKLANDTIDDQIRMRAMWQLYTINKQIVSALKTESMETLQSLAVSWPDSEFAATALHDSALMNAEAGDFRIADANFEKLISDFPYYRSRSNALADYAEFLIEQNPLDERIGDILEVYLRDSVGHKWEKRGMLALGFWLEGQEDFDKAASIFERAAERWPDSAEGKEALASLNSIANRIDDPERRLQYLRSRLADQETALNAAAILERKCRPEEAAILLKSAVQRGDESIALNAAIARNLELAGQYTEAAERYEDILESSKVDNEKKNAAWRLANIYSQNMNKYQFQGPGLVFLRDTSNLNTALKYLEIIHKKPSGREDKLAHDALLKAAHISARELYDNHKAEPLYRRLLKEFPDSPAREEAEKYLNM